ncbi:MAG: MFS transporter [Kiritimatiellae bacterium]|nr:MFS transporter [Kiritimatiellia bacterium]
MSRPPIRGLRWWIAALLVLSTTLNYLDRQALSALAQTVQRALELSNEDYARITSSFLLSYGVMYLLGGTLVDLLGVRRSLALFVLAWSLATAGHGLAASLAHLCVARFLLGVAQPGNFPAGVRAVSEWFPMRERAMAVGLFNAGTALGSTLAMPVVSALALRWGWRAAFVGVGALGLPWLAAWLWLYRAPSEHPRLAPEELARIRDGAPAAPSASRIPWRWLLRAPETWGCVAVRVLTDPISYFLAFWTPKYFQAERGFDLKQVGTFAWLPFLGMALGSTAGGALPRWLTARGWSVNRARKTTMALVAIAMPALCLAVTRVRGAPAALAVMFAIMFGHGAYGNITLPAEAFPSRVVGTVSGLGGALGAAVGVLTQLHIGVAVDRWSYRPLFAVCGSAYAVGLLVVMLTIPRLGHPREPPAPTPPRTR